MLKTMTGSISSRAYQNGDPADHRPAVVRRGRRCWPALLALAILAAGPATAAGLGDQLIAFYTSAMPNPPRVELDIGRVVALAETGDIIIENNRAFPQWAMMIGMLVPGTRYVHAGMVVKGHVLRQLNQRFGRLLGRPAAFSAWRRTRVAGGAANQPGQAWRWVPLPQIHYGRAYVVTPEVVGDDGLSRVVALDLEDYLRDPRLGYPCKHVKLLRPGWPGEAALQRVADYLGYHLAKETAYDMGFSLAEEEKALRRRDDGRLDFDLGIMPVPLYCTELVLRALRAGDRAAPTTFLNRKAAAVARAIPRLPTMVVEKLDSPFITADCFIPVSEVLYSNEESPNAGRLLASLTNQGFRRLCQSIGERFARIAGATRRKEAGR